MLKQSSSRIKSVLTILLASFFDKHGNECTDNSSSKVVDIIIQSFASNPDTVKISAGDAVRWTNMDSADHTVVGSIFKSGLIPKGQNYQFRFTESGVHNYECSIHPSMKGTITVVAKK